MEIKVKGVGEKKVKPDAIKFYITFGVKRADYEICLADGTKNVDNYFEFLEKQGFNRKDIKTKNFNIHKEKLYNETTRKYDEGDYVFEFCCELQFDYDLTKMSVVLNESTKLQESPTLKVEFVLKDEKKQIQELMALAFQDAQEQASVIARASGKDLKDCLKTSFEPFDEHIGNSYDGMRATCGASRMPLEEIFVPDDIELSFTLYTLWEAQ